MNSLLAAPLLALAPVDEGMWTFDNPPVKQLQEKYGFTPDAAWLERLRLSSVRFNSGGSGSFVSSEGLVMTNHHVGLDTLHSLVEIMPVRYAMGMIEDGGEMVTMSVTCWYLLTVVDRRGQAPEPTLVARVRGLLGR